MNGEVDHSGRAIVNLSVRPSADVDASPLAVWVDTAFTGELVIPRKTVQALKLRQSAAVKAGLADGTQVVLETYSCLIDWFGRTQIVEVVENEGQTPLLGTGLLRDRRLEIDYRLRTVVIE
jgi:clan AA aspartic protease